MLLRFSFVSRTKDGNRRWGFTLLELLAVIAIVAILAALIFSGLAKARQSARRTQCIGNLKQIAAAVLMYADDHQQRLPGRDDVPGISGWHTYQGLIRPYLAATGPSASRPTVFICSADKFHYDGREIRVSAGWHEQTNTDGSSYGYNNANLIRKKPDIRYPEELMGVGLQLDTWIVEPSKTIMVGEITAWPCYSWHEPKSKQFGNYRFNNAKSAAGFVDGHVKYIPFHYDKLKGPESWYYDPPPNYEYRWSAR